MWRSGRLTRTLRIVINDKAEREFSFANRFPLCCLRITGGLEGRQFSLTSMLVNPKILSGPCSRRQRPREQNLSRNGLALDLDLDIYTGGKIQPLQRVNSLRRRVDDVDQTLVDPHLKVLLGVLVLVR